MWRGAMRPDERIMCNALGHPAVEEPRARITDAEIEEFRRKLEERTEIEVAKRRKQREKDDAEVRRLMADLKEHRKLLPKEEIDLEEAKRESVAYYKAIPMWDWGAKVKSNEHDMYQKYGSGIINKIKRCVDDAIGIPKSTIAEMHRIHEGRPPLQKKQAKPVIGPVKKLERPITSQVNWNELEKTPDLKPKEYRNDNFCPIKAGIFNMARQNSHLRNPTTLLLYLLQHKSWEGKKDKHDTYGTWFLKRNLIVASVGVEKICTDLGVHEKTIRNWTNALHNGGVIRKLKDGPDNVYILGEVIDNKELFYYSGEIRWNSNSGSIH